MKKILWLVLGLGLLVVGLPAQFAVQDRQRIEFGELADTDSVVQLAAETAGLERVLPQDLPRTGTFWLVLAETGVMAPLPCPPSDPNLPIFQIADGQFLVDATDGQVALKGRNGKRSATAALEAQAAAVTGLIEQVQTAQFERESARFFGEDEDLDSSARFSPMLAVADEGGLWLEITNYANGLASVNLHNATNQVYAILSKTNLLSETWTVERMIWPTNATVMSFTVPTLGRQNLLISARDWTAVDDNANALPDWWEWEYFADLSLTATNDYDGDGVSILNEYTNHVDPNKISFSCAFPNQYVATNIVNGIILVSGGVPAQVAVLVDSTNFTGATWSAYTTSNLTVDLGSALGSHKVWVGLRGLPADAQPTWQETTLILDANSPTLAITNPVDNVTFNSSRVNVSGNFASASLKQISVNGVLAFIHGTNFNAVNVPLAADANIVTATIENLAGLTNAVTLIVNTTPNLDGSLNDPVQLQATPAAGFSPLPVAFQIGANQPGTIQQVAYDFNGDDLADFITNTLAAITNTYTTNGEFFPFVTIQTTVGQFSSVGGWNAVPLDATNEPIRINVQSNVTLTTFANITDPVDLKWLGTNLYVLSRSTSTLTEFDADGKIVRSVGDLGVPPPLGDPQPNVVHHTSFSTSLPIVSGFDVDSAGNVYVAITSSNQVWKYVPTSDSFSQGSFQFGNYLGDSSGTNNGEFDAPYDVAVSPDGSQLAVSDSGNHRIQFFDSNGTFINAFGSQGSGLGQFNTPKGLTYDATGTLYIVDSGNDRIVTARDGFVQGITGTNGTVLGQFSDAVNLCLGTRGVYVADTGNNRIQKFDLPAHSTFSITSASTRFAVSTNFNQPSAVAAVNNFTNDLFYVADTANNRVILCKAPSADAAALQTVWNSMTARVAAGDISGAASYFSSVSADKYRQAFLALGTGGTTTAISQIGALTQATIESDTAQSYFEQTIDGQTITFPVEFTKENGAWKIDSF